MDRKKQTILVQIYDRLDIGSATLGLVGLIAAAVAVDHALSSLLSSVVGILFALSYFCIAGSMARPLWSLASGGHPCIRAVCVLSGVLVLLFLIMFYTSYFAIVGTTDTSKLPAAKILDLPPIIAAAWAAATGWYVHFQMTTRSHQVANSVKLVVDTRTNSEFRKNQQLVKLRLPTCEAVAAVDSALYPLGGMALADAEVRACRNELSSLHHDSLNGVNDQAIAEKRIKLISAKARLADAAAIDSLKYLLNFYEMLALGINRGDFDEDLIYETISPSVVGTYTRAKDLIAFLRSPETGEVLAFEHLQKLVELWGRKLSDDMHELTRRP